MLADAEPWFFTNIGEVICKGSVELTEPFAWATGVLKLHANPGAHVPWQANFSVPGFNVALPFGKADTVIELPVVEPAVMLSDPGFTLTANGPAIVTTIELAVDPW